MEFKLVNRGGLRAALVAAGGLAVMAANVGLYGGRGRRRRRTVGSNSRLIVPQKSAVPSRICRGADRRVNRLLAGDDGHAVCGDACGADGSRRLRAIR